MKMFKKIANIVIDILVVLILIISATILTLSLTSQDTGTPNVFGYTLNTVQSASMEPEMYKGDLLIGRSTPAYDNYDVGDIVFFQSSAYSEEEGYEIIVVKCHRIVEKKEVNGDYKYLTKGDNNEDTDESIDGWIYSEKIVGIYQTKDYQGKKLDNLGTIIDYLQSFWGFFFVIVLPMIIFFIYELVRVLMNFAAYNREKALVAAQEAAQSAELSEQQKQKAIEEYLAQQAALQKNKEEEPMSEQSDSAD